jgi:hypothetical protein
MKTHLIAAILFLNCGLLNAQNPNWRFVGPYSTDQSLPSSDPDYNPFRAGMVTDIAVDPGDPNQQHIIASGHHGGIWETYNYVGGSTPSADWNLLPDFDKDLPYGMERNGVSAIAFRNQYELYAANFIFINSKIGYSNAVFKYDYSALPDPTWTQCGTLPSTNQPYVINRIVFFTDAVAEHIFLCTSKGLIESTDAGANWSTVSGVAGNIHSIVFIEKATANTYYWYVSGGTTSGSTLLMESDNGGAFSDMMSYSSMATYANQIGNYFESFGGICLGDQTATNGDRDIYISTAVRSSSTTLSCCSNSTPCGCCSNSWVCNDRLLHRLTKNISTGSTAVAYLTNTGQEYYNTPDRLVIGYDASTNHVITGGVYTHAIDLSSNTENTSLFYSSIHDDYHALYINTSINPNQILLGTDGGFASINWDINNSEYNSTRLNNGLNIALINGFSGATEDNIYVYGQQDHTYSGLYNENTGKVITIRTNIGENDGGLIDKFNGNNLIIGDYSSYNPPNYMVSTTGASGFSSTSSIGFYAPSNSPSYYFEPGNALSPQPTGWFGVHPFFQHPFREDRIFATGNGHWSGSQTSAYQFDPISHKFVGKVRLQESTQHFTGSPTFSSCYTCTPDLSTDIGKVHNISEHGQPCGISFSQMDNNIMYLVTSIQPDPCCVRIASQVVKYIGNNVDDIWYGHNEVMDNTGTNPQWQLITPDWLYGSNTNNLVTLLEDDIYSILFTNVETSNWDKNKIYVTCSANLPCNTFCYKVLVYDGNTGLWDDYSGTTIPSDAHVTSMVMDHASNDGIYISTEYGVYYREAGMSDWVLYNAGAPVLISRQMEINYRENTVRTGTYGRGIWKSDLVCPSNTNLTIPAGTASGYYEADDIITNNNSVTTASTGSTAFRATNSVTLQPNFTATAASDNYFVAFIHGCIGGSSSTSSYNYHRPIFNLYESQLNRKDKGFSIYPNPNLGSFTIRMNKDDNSEKSVAVLDLIGNIVWQQQNNLGIETVINISEQPKGIYFVKIKQGDKVSTQKIVLM